MIFSDYCSQSSSFFFSVSLFLSRFLFTIISSSLSPRRDDHLFPLTHPWFVSPIYRTTTQRCYPNRIKLASVCVSLSPESFSSLFMTNQCHLSEEIRLTLRILIVTVQMMNSCSHIPFQSDWFQLAIVTPVHLLLSARRLIGKGKSPLDLLSLFLSRMRRRRRRRLCVSHTCTNSFSLGLLSVLERISGRPREEMSSVRQDKNIHPLLTSYRSTTNSISGCCLQYQRQRSLVSTSRNIGQIQQITERIDVQFDLL